MAVVVTGALTVQQTTFCEHTILGMNMDDFDGKAPP